MTRTTRQIERFEEAFRPSVSSCRAVCACGVQFYNPDRSWSWDSGELEALDADPNAVGIAHSVGYVEFEGKTYVDACTCWHERAAKIAEWLDAHDRGIAKYLSIRKKDFLAHAQSLPTVE